MTTLLKLPKIIFDFGAINALPGELAELGVAKPLFISDQGLVRCGVFGKARQAIGDDPGIHDLARMRV